MRNATTKCAPAQDFDHSAQCGRVVRKPADVIVLDPMRCRLTIRDPKVRLEMARMEMWPRPYEEKLAVAIKLVDLRRRGKMLAHGRKAKKVREAGKPYLRLAHSQKTPMQIGGYLDDETWRELAEIRKSIKRAFSRDAGFSGDAA